MGGGGGRESLQGGGGYPPPPQHSGPDSTPGIPIPQPRAQPHFQPPVTAPQPLHTPCDRSATALEFPPSHPLPFKQSPGGGGGRPPRPPGNTRHTSHVEAVDGTRTSGGVAHPRRRRGGSRRQTRGPGVRAPTSKDKTPPQDQPPPPQTNDWAPRAHERGDAHRPRGRADNAGPPPFSEGRMGDCPGPRKQPTKDERSNWGGGG